ncbi:hypothetical protein [Flagellimonas flava]|uniref:HEAT repeat-containing protein n=1 Tax=Flagellimonas flava TaxID=570519 RepID=A0A1M5HX26_9FLAO|nr:hypothetical protein [Allomuricauda flava]SHG20528.1 hypothetical protein SAMN04488116_0267 [Allomuricauda flava]
MKNFEKRLTGGHPNSLGNTIEVVNDVLQHHEYFEELFNCYFSDDEVVRLRVSNAMKRIAKEEKQLLVPYLNRFLNEISQIDQASTQWTLAQLFLLLEDGMNQDQMSKARLLLQNNLANHKDWIVLSQTMETLGQWAKKDDNLNAWLRPHLVRLSKDARKSVSKKATKTLEILEN